jgi:hypothetical protein
MFDRPTIGKSIQRFARRSNMYKQNGKLRTFLSVSSVNVSIGNMLRQRYTTRIGGHIHAHTHTRARAYNVLDEGKEACFNIMMHTHTSTYIEKTNA